MDIGDGFRLILVVVTLIWPRLTTLSSVLDNIPNTDSIQGDEAAP